MPLLFRFALALGLAVAGASIASADLPKAVSPDNVNPDREWLLQNIRAIRSILQQEKLAICGAPPQEVESMEQELRKLESAYFRGRPVRIKSPPPDPRREMK